MYFHQKEPIKVEIWWNFMWAVKKSKILHFDKLLLSNSNKVSAKKVQESYLSWHCRVMQTLKKNWCLVSNVTFGEFSRKQSKVWKFDSDGLLFSKVYKVWSKKIQGNYLSWPWTVMQNLNKLWPCSFKNGTRN